MTEDVGVIGSPKPSIALGVSSSTLSWLLSYVDSGVFKAVPVQFSNKLACVGRVAGGRGGRGGLLLMSMFLTKMSTMLVLL